MFRFVSKGPWLTGLPAVVLGFASCGSGAPGSQAGPSASSEEAWFSNVLDGSGIDFVHSFGTQRQYLFPETLSGGVALFDFDGDGLLDVYLVQGGDLRRPRPGQGNRLYRNLGAMRFEDVTESAGVGDEGYGIGCTAGDYDGDGRVDLYVNNLQANVLYKNLGGGRFEDVTRAAGVGHPGWSSSSAFFDYDGDGDLDLFVVNYLQWSLESDIECESETGERDYCDPNSYRQALPDVLYRNEGDGTFRDVSREAGIQKSFGNGLGVVCADLNGDGRIDVYVANDGMPNQLWINSGQGTFTDESLALGCSVNAEGKSEAGMGVAAVDVESDGDLDLFVVHVRDETNTFYLNNGRWFEDATAAMGLARSSYEFTGFGMGFADFDHDGRLDLYVANGRVKRYAQPPRADDPYAEANLLFVPAGEPTRFQEKLPRGGTRKELVDTSRAAAFGDLDNDGDVDILVANAQGAPYLLRNDAGGGAWAMFSVLDDAGRHALHAVLELRTANGILRRRVESAYSFAASNDPRVHVGLGDAEEVQEVLVHWPSGEREAFGPFASGALHEIRAGQGRRVP